MNALIVTVESAGCYDGHDIKINGIQVAHRPYDGAYSDTVELEVAEAFGSLLRATLNLKKDAPERDEDW